MTEPIQSYSIQKYHRFSIPVDSINKFGENEESCDLFLVNDQIVYDLKTHNIVYTFQNKHTKKIPNNARFTGCYGYIYMIIQD